MKNVLAKMYFSQPREEMEHFYEALKLSKNIHENQRQLQERNLTLIAENKKLQKENEYLSFPIEDEKQPQSQTPQSTPQVPFHKPSASKSRTPRTTSSNQHDGQYNLTPYQVLNGTCENKNKRLKMDQKDQNITIFNEEQEKIIKVLRERSVLPDSRFSNTENENPIQASVVLESLIYKDNSSSDVSKKGCACQKKTKEIENLKKRNQEYEYKMQVQEEQIEKLTYLYQTQLDKYESDMFEKAKEIEQITIANHSLISQLQDQESNGKKQNEESEEKLLKENNLLQAIDTKDSELGNCLHGIEMVKKENISYQSQLQSSEDRFENQKEDLDNLRRSNGLLNSKLKKADSELGNYLHEIEMVKKENISYQSQIQSLEDRFENQKEDLDNLRRSNGLLNSKLKKADSELKDCVHEIEMVKKENISYQSQIQSSEDRFENQKEDLDNLRKSNGLLNSKLKKAGTELQFYKESLVVNTNKLAELKELQEKEKHFFISKLEDLSSQLTSLKQRNIDTKHMMCSLSTHHQRDLHDINTIITSGLQQKDQEYKTLLNSVKELQKSVTIEKKRRKLSQDKLAETLGNIRVHCRIRKMLNKDYLNQQEIVRKVDEEKIVLQEPAQKVGSCNLAMVGKAQFKDYEFDQVYNGNSTSVDVFADAAPYINYAMKGYNVCILAYGQTGSGKTHTMIGSEGEMDGIVPCAIREVFEITELQKHDMKLSISASILEIYNESFTDLLSKEDKKLTLCSNEDGGIEMKNLLAVDVTGVDMLLKLIAKANTRRKSTKTNVHDHSSRSHYIINLTLSIQRFSTETQTISKLQLVDLAGSECVKDSGVSGHQMTEASAINKSISALSDVLDSLRRSKNKKSEHIPYRNSKLTHYLSDCIGGNSKMVLFVCVSPTDKSITETRNSLKFGSKARQVEKGKAKINR